MGRAWASRWFQHKIEFLLHVNCFFPSVSPGGLIRVHTSIKIHRGPFGNMLSSMDQMIITISRTGQTRVEAAPGSNGFVVGHEFHAPEASSPRSPTVNVHANYYQPVSQYVRSCQHVLSHPVFFPRCIICLFGDSIRSAIHWCPIRSRLMCIQGGKPPHNFGFLFHRSSLTRRKPSLLCPVCLRA